MRKWTKVTCWAMGIAMASAMAVYAAGEAKTKVAVIEFENKSTWHWDDAGAPGELLVTQLVNAGSFSVIEREKLDLIMQEQNLGQSGAVTPQTAAKIGKLLGVNYIITGAVSEWSTTDKDINVGVTGMGKTAYTATVDVRAIDVNTGEIVAAVKGEGSETGFRGRGVVPVPLPGRGIGGVGVSGGEGHSEKRAAVALRDAVDKAGVQLIQKLGGAPAANVPGAGLPKVAKVAGKEVTINKGTEDNIQVGQVFSVYALGKEILDPDTGASLGQEESKIGSVKVTRVEAKYSVAETVDGKGFAAGNILRPE